jgi:hypothetical protein
MIWTRAITPRAALCRGHARPVPVGKFVGDIHNLKRTKILIFCQRANLDATSRRQFAYLLVSEKPKQKEREMQTIFRVRIFF